MTNPYMLADHRARGARRREEGPRDIGGALLALGAVATAIPLTRGSVYAFVDAAPDTSAFALGATGLAARVALLLAGVLALGGYDHAVRGPDQAILAVHPCLPRPWLEATVRRVARARVGAWLAGVVLVTPLYRHPPALGLALAVVSGGWLAGLGLGLGVNLAAPRWGRSPALAPLWDAVRGMNPRAQAALLYAPGVALLLAGAGVLAASAGMGALLAGPGSPLAWAGLLAPGALAVAGWRLARASAVEATRIPALLGEVDAAHAAAGSPEEARAVWMDWSARWVPATLRPRYLQELRHAGRGLRGWVLAGWALGALGALAAWGQAADAAGRAWLTAGLGVLALGFTGVRAAATDPEWLDAVLPLRGRAPARALALLSLAQGAVLPPVLTLALSHTGSDALHLLLRLEGLALALAGGCALATARLRGAGALVYLPLGILLLAAGAPR